MIPPFDIFHIADGGCSREAGERFKSSWRESLALTSSVN
jgi:hypothetical protein